MRAVLFADSLRNRGADGNAFRLLWRNPSVFGLVRILPRAFNRNHKRHDEARQYDVGGGQLQRLGSVREEDRSLRPPWLSQQEKQQIGQASGEYEDFLVVAADGSLPVSDHGPNSI